MKDYYSECMAKMIKMEEKAIDEQQEADLKSRQKDSQ